MTAKAVSLRIQDKKVWSGKELDGHAPSWPTLLRQMKFKHEDFKTIPEELKSILNGLEEYRHGNLFPPNYRHDDIASELSQGSHPSYTIVVFEEILAPEHRNDKRFVKIDELVKTPKTPHLSLRAKRPVLRSPSSAVALLRRMDRLLRRVETISDLDFG